MSRYPSLSPARLLFVTGIAILLCAAAISGCTQPVIPMPGTVSTTPPPVVTTSAPSPPQAPTAQATPKGSTDLTYSNTQYGFTLNYPSGWTKLENAGTSVVTFTSPSTGMGDTPAIMRVTVDDLSASPMSLEQYKAAQLAKKKGIDSFNLIYDQAYKGVGFSGWKIAYTGNQGTLMEWVEVNIVKGTTGYTLNFASKEDKYANYVVHMDNLFKSFQLTY
jgi:hypothetical protein